MLRYVGYVAGFLTVMSFLPQVLRAWRTRAAHDLSLRACILFVVAAMVWTAYGISRTDWPIILTNGGLFVLSSALLVAKLRFGRGGEGAEGHPAGITGREGTTTSTV